MLREWGYLITQIEASLDKAYGTNLMDGRQDIQSANVANKIRGLYQEQNGTTATGHEIGGERYSAGSVRATEFAETALEKAALQGDNNALASLGQFNSYMGLK